MTKRNSAATAAALPASDQPEHHALLTSAGAAAALIASTAPATVAESMVPPADPDAALWTLRSRYLAAKLASAAENTPRTPAEQAIIDAAPPVPMFGGREEIAEAIHARTAALDVLPWPKPTAEAEAGFTAALNDECRIIDAIVATPARTLAGLAFKAEIVTAEAYLNNELTHSVMLDIAALAAAHPMLTIPA